MVTGFVDADVSIGSVTICSVGNVDVGVSIGSVTICSVGDVDAGAIVGSDITSFGITVRVCVFLNSHASQRLLIVIGLFFFTIFLFNLLIHTLLSI